MTVDSAYYIRRIDNPNKEDPEQYIVPIESIGDTAMQVYAIFEDPYSKSILPMTMYRLEYETVRDPIFKRAILFIDDPLALGSYVGLQIQRYTPRVRDFTVLDKNRFPSNEFENQMDKITYILQELEGHLCGCNTDTTTVTPPVVPIPETGPGPIDPPTPPTCKVYSCDANDVAPIDLYGLSLSSYWSLGASKMAIPNNTVFPLDSVITADVQGAAGLTVKMSGITNPVDNFVTVGDFFFFFNEGSEEVQLCVPDGHGGPGGLRFSNSGDTYLQSETDSGGYGGFMAEVSTGENLAIRSYWDMDVGGRVDGYINIEKVFINPNYVVNLTLSASGPLGADSETILDSFSLPASWGSDHPFPLQWGFSIAGGNVTVVAHIGDVEAYARQFTGIYDSAAVQQSQGLQIYGTNSNIRSLWMRAPAITLEEYRAFEDAWKRNFLNYIDPDPTCVPPTP